MPRQDSVAKPRGRSKNRFASGVDLIEEAFSRWHVALPPENAGKGVAGLRIGDCLQSVGAS
jgi:hypothetical protein